MHSRKALFEGAHEIFFLAAVQGSHFFLLFAFAMGNRDEVALHFMPGHVVTMPMMAVVLGSFALGVFLGILVMVPRWWRLRRDVRKAQTQMTVPEAVAVAESRQQASSSPADLERHMTDSSITIPYEP